MNAMQRLLTDSLDIWSAAETEKKSGRGRASGNAGSVYGIRKLRELILELAVRGKLVPQDANDEPASALLKRIQAEKAKLIAEGKIKKDKPLAPITEEEQPFKLPKQWEWVRLADLLTLVTDGDHQAPPKTESGVPFLVIGNLNTGNVLLEGCRFVPEKYYEKLDWGKKPNKNDLLYTVTGSYGIPIKVDISERFCVQRHVAILKTSKSTPVTYLGFVLKSKYALRYASDIATGIAQKTVPLTGLRVMPIAMPPESEQHRIVAKVDELMALCDQLEARHSNAVDAHEKLVSHLLATLTQSQTAEDFSANWQRIAAHFDTLFSTEASIDALKQTLLQLAVMGKLVPQEANDEPASELLKRIQAEKARLIAEGKIRKDKPLPAIAEEDNPFDLPNGWEWVRLGALVEKSGAGWSPSCEGHPRVENEWGVLKVSAVSWGKFLPDENKALPKTLEARLDCVVETGDFLVSRANTAELVARSVVVEECPQNLMLSDKIVRLRLSSLCDNRFINLANSSLFARSYYSFVAGGTSSSMKNVSREQILNLIVGKPPLAEQHRIVAKVDELMARCDQLKSRITDASQLQQKLADVLVEQAVA